MNQIFSEKQIEKILNHIQSGLYEYAIKHKDYHLMLRSYETFSNVMADFKSHNHYQ